MAEKNEDLLVASDVSLRFGAVLALDGLTFSVGRGEIVGIIGPNGSGKTSFLNCVNGIARPQSGSVRFEQTELVGKPSHAIARLGIARTFQAPSLQLSSTVAENILFGCDFRMKYGLFSAAVYLGRARSQEIAQRAAVDKIISFLGIGGIRDSAVGDLPWALQKLVEIGRALVSEPKLLLLDEPTSGMTREEKEDVAYCITAIHEQLGISQILIEHDAQFVKDLCHRVVALDFGRVIAAGPADEVLADPAVVTAYLGMTAKT